MVYHQTVGMNAAPVAFDTLLKQEKKPATVFVVKEDVGTAVATEHNVVERAGIMDSLFTRHGMSLDQVCNFASLTRLLLVFQQLVFQQQGSQYPTYRATKMGFHNRHTDRAEVERGKEIFAHQSLNARLPYQPYKHQDTDHNQ